MQPINKQASIFLSRKPRVDSVEEALNIFATKLCSPGVADNVREVVKASLGNENKVLNISMKIRGDAKTPGAVSVTMQTSFIEGLSEESLFGLK